MYVSLWLWLQTAEGMGPVGAGLALLPLSLAGFLVAAASGKLLHGASHRITIGGGLLLIAAGALLQGWMLDAGDGWTALVPGLAVTGVGVGLISPALAAAAMGAVPPARAGMAGGALNTARQLGMALGIAVLGAVFHTGLADGLAGSGQPHGTAAALAGGGAARLLDTVPGAGSWVEAAFASGLRDTFWVSGAMGLAGALILFVLVRRPVAGSGGKGPVPVPVPGQGSAPAERASA
ncbi:MFS transporter [Streptomyces sp. 5.8]|uniref:MFS transporter n=1 Tax=Streptomyces sp. 5.8 TaxID=3406571 RepID=UPI003BB4902E